MGWIVAQWRWVGIVCLSLMLSFPALAIHPGMYRDAERMALVKSVTLLFMKTCKDRCVPNSVAIVNKELDHAYSGNSPVSLGIEGSTGLITISMDGMGTSYLMPNTWDRVKELEPGNNGHGNGSSGRNHEPDSDNDPPPPQWFGIIMLLTILIWIYALGRFILWIVK